MIQMRRYEEAVRAAETAIRFDPENEWSFRLLSVGLLGERRPKPIQFLSVKSRRAALRAAEESVRIAPSAAAPRMQLSIASGANGRRAQAVLAAEQAVQMAPNASPPFNVLGVAALRVGRIRGAEAAFRKSLQIDPQNSEALNNLGLVARARGRVTEAPEHFGASVRSNPRSFMGARNAARMSNTLIGQMLDTIAVLLLLFAGERIVRPDVRGSDLVVVVGAVGAALATRFIWRAVRDTYRPTLLAISLRPIGRVAAGIVAVAGGVVAGALSSEIGGLLVFLASFMRSIAGLGPIRSPDPATVEAAGQSMPESMPSGGKSGRATVGWSVFRDAYLLVLLVVIASGLVASLARAEGATQAAGLTIVLGLCLVAAIMMAIALWRACLLLRWVRRGSTPILDAVEAGQPFTVSPR